MSKATTIRILEGDARTALRAVKDDSVQCAVTSPPYWGLRLYDVEPLVWDGKKGCKHKWGEKHRKSGSQICLKCGAYRGQLGMEPHFSGYIRHLIQVFREVRRTLNPLGTFWLNISDSYNGSGGAGGDYNRKGKRHGQKRYPGRNVPELKQKDLVGIPWRTAMALQQPWLRCPSCEVENHRMDWGVIAFEQHVCPACLAFVEPEVTETGWYLRGSNVWAKDGGGPESVKDRCPRSYEYIFLFSKSRQYFFDMDAIREPHSEVSKRRSMRGNKASKYSAGTHLPYGVHAMTMSTPREHRGYDNMEEMIRQGKTTLHPLGKSKSNVWRFTTSNYKGSHYASFPEMLPEVCVKAGSSEYGRCADCNAPWLRLPYLHSRGLDLEWRPSCNCHGKWERLEVPIEGVRRVPTYVSEIPLEQHPVRRCVVLDPFGGVGTTSVVAHKLGRDSVLVELGEEYVREAQVRFSKDATGAKVKVVRNRSK